jgi:mRNA-degrading endonuclease RelE of RelBE toxin-antitoxin system
VASTHSIEISPTAFRTLKAIRNRKVQSEIRRAIDGLARIPDAQGKSLFKPLEGLRSIRAVRSRHRILYKVDEEREVVSVLLIGERRPGEEEDVYSVARRLARLLLGD